MKEFKKKSLSRFEIEPHPFDPFLNQDSTHLIIGTFPTSKPTKYRFYYAGENNFFWKIMEKAYNVKFRYNEGEIAVRERKDFLRDRKLAMVDMHEECYRKNDSSQDCDLYSVKLRDVKAILQTHPTIKSLVFTSRTDAIGAFGLFKTYAYLNGLPNIDVARLGNGLLTGTFSFLEKQFKVWVPYSPSMRSDKSKELGVAGLSKMYEQCFNDKF